ncbi:MAG: bifunctional glutamate N-acetyltransferase/amino-acid acetyltransferase ArgJ [Eubacteriales bacterium]|nr:bifunctional glutamate N-acetyltransferase/amino-acid acetyltransferase ArgJ [Eubacteriales bacterium]MDD4389392.1 bifunctional glutamate N-acetyltransferase/amino-acid acetyltransferase ArgJ [Eubacteriales bacterium]
MKIISGGVCAAKGFTAAGIYSGIKKNKEKKDLALIKSSVKANAAVVFTTNNVKAAHIGVSAKHISDGMAEAILCNSGNANTCTTNGAEIALNTCKLVGKSLHINASDVLVASTGVIGQDLAPQPFETGIPQLVSLLDDSEEASNSAASAIMTTDLVDKQYAVSFELAGKTCTIGAIAKGSGMICPNMATMLAFVTTDVAISSEMLQKALSDDVQDSFNMVSVDGDTSTNDTCIILANGLAGNPKIIEEGADFDVFKEALAKVTIALSRMIAKDGEGATKLIACEVTGSVDKKSAAAIAKSVIKSSLVKTTILGADANWGRVLCAIGYSDIDINPDKIDVAFASAAGKIMVCEGGAGVNFSEDLAKKILLEDEVEIKICLNVGTEKATAWGCDLTYEYVRINGDYRS